MKYDTAMSHIRNYWVLPLAMGPSTFLEGIGEVPDLLVTKTGKLSIF